MKLRGNTILITGGSSGIGLSMVKKFYELENQLIIVAKDKIKLENVQRLFPKVAIYSCDLSQNKEVDGLISFVKLNYPKLNVLINNAGIQYNYDFFTELELSKKIIEEVAINFTSTVRLCGGLLTVLSKNNHATIVNVSSGLAIVPKKSAPVYCATKSAIHSFTKALRYQMEEHGIKVFEVLPSLVDTPMTEGRGKNKITADSLVKECIKGFEKENYEIYIGKTKLLKLIHRVSPLIAHKIMKNS